MKGRSARLDEHRHSTMLGPDDSFSQVAGRRCATGSIFRGAVNCR
jgi:hypothetical protein